MSRLILVRSDSREEGIGEVLRRVGLDSILEGVGNYVLVKPNFNDAHPYPATTSRETLEVLCDILSAKVGRDKLVIGDGSSMYEAGNEVGFTRKVMEKNGVLTIDVPRHAFFEEEEEVPVKVDGLDEPLYYPRTVVDASKIIYVPVLKVHSMPAPFTLGLKNTVGATCWRTRRWLHGGDFWKRLIQINLGIKVDLVVVDGSKMLTSGGPSTGTIASSNLYLASTSRLAVDAVGGAILKHHGAVFKKMGVEFDNQKVGDFPHIKYAEEFGFGKVGDIKLETNFEDNLTQFIRDELQIN